MKKMMITGVSSGLGKALFEYYDGKYIQKYKDVIEVEGHSRRYNQHDIQDIKDWFDPEADIFINNAYSDLRWWTQTNALLYSFSVWADKPDKHIVSISSIAQEKDTDGWPIGHSRYSVGKISLDKMNLDCHEKVAKKHGCKVSNLRLGWVETPRTTRISTVVSRLYDVDPVKQTTGTMLSTDECIDAIDFMLNHSGRVREMTLEAK